MMFLHFAFILTSSYLHTLKNVKSMDGRKILDNHLTHFDENVTCESLKILFIKNDREKGNKKRTANGKNVI